MALGPLSIPEIKFCGTMFNIDVCMVVHFYLEFMNSGDSLNIGALGDQMAIEFLNTNLLSELTDELEFHTLELRDLNDEDEFAVVSTSRQGQASGDAMPAFVAYGFKKNIATRATRPGSLRVPGVIESAITNGAWNVPGNITTWVNQVIEITIPSDQLNDVIVRPIVVGRNPDGSYDTGRTNIVTAITPTRVTTQNSRKR